MEWSVYWPYVLVMAGVTYMTRMIPMVLIRKKIKSRFIRSFLYYVPFAVLTAMTIPGILYSTNSLITASVGLGVAIILSWREKPLLLVAVAATAAVFITRMLIGGV